MTKTEELYKRLKVGNVVYYLEYWNPLEMPTLSKVKIKTKDYCVGKTISLNDYIHNDTDRVYAANALKELFTNNKLATEAYLRRLKYHRSITTTSINKEKKLLQEINEAIEEIK